jgi:tRNA(adenine34) deaminase
MTEFSPGTSPPPVSTPIRFGVAMAPMVASIGAGATSRSAPGGGYDPGVNYELYMGEALAEARAAVAHGERPNAAVAVLDEAMVARGHTRVRESDDPTAHAVIVALREAARRVGRERLRDVTIFCTLEPCPMCVGALLATDVEALVYAIPNRTDGAAGTMLQLAEHPSLKRRVKVVSGIRRDEAEELYAAAVR